MEVPSELRDMGKGNARNKKEVHLDGNQVYVSYDTFTEGKDVLFIFEIDELKDETKKTKKEDIMAYINGLNQQKLDELIEKKLHKKKGVFIIGKKESTQEATSPAQIIQ